LFSFLRSNVGVLVGIAVAKLVIHLLTSQDYGYFRDEFYYIAASKHLDLCYEINWIICLSEAENWCYG